jgi:ferritin-like metal-binding protein YciE
VRDAAIISAAQKIEHYEIASYGTLCAFAKVLGLEEVADLLEQTLEEEKEADSKLTDVAESSVNFEALAESE